MVLLTSEIEHQDLWNKYLENRSVENRNAIVVEHIGLVRSVSLKTYNKLSVKVDQEDLFSYGMFGLIQAVERFDVTRMKSFGAFAVPRIRGAILDNLRTNSEHKRVATSHKHTVERSIHSFRIKHNRTPTVEEIAVESGINEDRVFEILNGQVFRKATRLDSEEAVEIASNHESPSVRREKSRILRYISKSLNVQERIVVILYYMEQLTFREIGISIGCSESRISQIHSALIARLQEHLKHRKEFLFQWIKEAV